MSLYQQITCWRGPFMCYAAYMFMFVHTWILPLELVLMSASTVIWVLLSWPSLSLLCVFCIFSSATTTQFETVIIEGLLKMCVLYCDSVWRILDQHCVSLCDQCTPVVLCSCCSCGGSTWGPVCERQWHTAPDLQCLWQWAHLLPVVEGRAAAAGWWEGQWE